MVTIVLMTPFDTHEIYILFKDLNNKTKINVNKKYLGTYF